ncbi:hypothetical protein Tco_0592387 [Tanacetum coccineum]
MDGRRKMGWKEPTPVKHNCKPFHYKNGCSEWPTCSWREDGYYNRGNLLGAYIIGNTLRYQDLEWYDALKTRKLKEEALKNKAIIEGMIDEDKESSNEGWRRWDDFDNTNHDNKSKNEMEHEEEERLIMKYLVKISKKARIMELKRRHLKITVLTINMPYPSRKIRHICACTSQKTTEETRSNTPKLIKTLSLDESRSPEFNLFSDLEEYFKEEVAETMAETME